MFPEVIYDTQTSPNKVQSPPRLADNEKFAVLRHHWWSWKKDTMISRYSPPTIQGWKLLKRSFRGTGESITVSLLPFSSSNATAKFDAPEVDVRMHGRAGNANFIGGELIHRMAVKFIRLTRDPERRSLRLSASLTVFTYDGSAADLSFPAEFMFTAYYLPEFGLHVTVRIWANFWHSVGATTNL